MASNYDETKNRTNLNKHGISLAEAHQFDFMTAQTMQDMRRDYGEIRHISLGYIGARLHVLVWTVRDDTIRPISLRKANKRERQSYDR